MAEVSYLHLPDDDQDDVVVPLDSFPFDPDRDFSPSDLSFSLGRPRITSPARVLSDLSDPDSISAVDLLDSENLIIDLLRQGVEQLSIGGDSGFPYPDPSLGFMEADDDTGPTHVGIVDLGSGLGFDDGGLEDYVCDEDPSLAFCWDTLQLQEISPGRFDFEWEEVDDEREALSMFFDEDEDVDEDLDASVPTLVPSRDDVGAAERRNSEWEVLLNAHNFDTNVDGEHDGGEYYYTAEYETLFAQFTEAEHALVGRPPASKAIVDDLPLVVVDDGNALCAICKDEIEFGGQAKQLPCSHHYHGACIVPWLGIRNTCPVCRYELPTDDPAYERRRTQRERAGRVQ